MARVMLALKTVLAAEDEIPVLVFDEVDANVGGETANVVGVKMRQIAQRRQVLCITHLAQVADASGRVLGLVAMEDVLETLVGEVRDPAHRVAEPRRTEERTADPDGALVG